MAKGKRGVGPNHATKTKIICRVCGPQKPQILRSFYKEHLKVQHQDETGNLREWNQGSISFSSQSVGSKNNFEDPEDHVQVSIGNVETNDTDEEIECFEDTTNADHVKEVRSGRSHKRGRSSSSSQSSESRSPSKRNKGVGQENSHRSRSRSSWNSSEISRSSSRSKECDDLDNLEQFKTEIKSYKVKQQKYIEDDEEFKAKIRSYEVKQSYINDAMDTITAQVDRLLDKVGASADLTDCNNNGYEELTRKLEVLEKHLEVKENVQNLQHLLEKYSKALPGQQTETKAQEIKEDDLAAAFFKCSSMEDIEQKFPELKYSIEKQKVKCLVCEKMTGSYSADLEYDFSGKVQSQEFRHLKQILRKHLVNKGHTELLNKAGVNNEVEEKFVSREKKIGGVLGCVAYYLLKQGRPNTDFPVLVNILAAAGVDIGDLNHSSEFVAHWGPVCASVIQKKLKTYLGTALLQTGYRPPCKGVADKATWQHYTRMICGLVTVVPDSPCLLQAFLTGTEVCPHGSGESMTASLVKVWDQYITGSQYNGLAADGATLHCNVGSKLSTHYNRTVMSMNTYKLSILWQCTNSEQFGNI